MGKGVREGIWVGTSMVRGHQGWHWGRQGNQGGYQNGQGAPGMALGWAEGTRVDTRMVREHQRGHWGGQGHLQVVGTGPSCGC